MKAPKSHPQNERPRRINNRINLARYSAGLVLVLFGLISAELMKCPIQLASAETIVPGWSYTGSLNTPRSAHTATLLHDGKVLVAGGWNSRNLDSAELYDPATGKWNVTGSLNEPREVHTATLLKDGKVLVAGGDFLYGVWGYYSLNGAELYDPQTERWSVTGSLKTRREGHTATLLKNGKVLVVGGIESLGNEKEDGTVLDTAELYDPDTGMWSVTGSLNTALAFHTATLLQNGKVLVLGEGSAELYDPDTGKWSRIDILGGDIKRYHHTATLLPDGRVLIVGGVTSGDPIRPTVLYDPETGAWSSTGDLNETRLNHTATLLPDGKVLVAGGVRYSVSGGMTSQVSLSSSELYDPATGTWSFAGFLNTQRSGHTATLLHDGILLLLGGADFNGDALDSVEVLDYHIAEPCAEPLPSTRQSFGAAGGDGSVSFTTASDCIWTVESTVTWIRVTSERTGTGSGTMSYSVAPNDSTAPRRGSITIAGRLFEVTQAGVPVRINAATVSGKNLVVTGENFDPGAVILLNGEEQKTKNQPQNPLTALIGKKAGKKIKSGDKLQVRNPNGTLSEEFTFTGI